MVMPRDDDDDDDDGDDEDEDDDDDDDGDDEDDDDDDDDEGLHLFDMSPINRFLFSSRLETLTCVLRVGAFLGNVTFCEAFLSKIVNSNGASLRLSVS